MLRKGTKFSLLHTAGVKLSLLILSLLFLQVCSSDNRNISMGHSDPASSDAGGGQNLSPESGLNSAAIPVSFVYSALENGEIPASSDNIGHIDPALAASNQGNGSFESRGLDLVSTGTNIKISVSGCATGYSVTNVSITSGVINLYKGDRNCLVKLTQFTLGSTTYASTGSNAVAFTTWLSGNVATFQNTISSTDLIKVQVLSQVTQGGVTGSDTVVYGFTDTSSLSANNISMSGYTFSMTGSAPLVAPGVTTGTSINIAVSGCASGYTLGTTAISSGVVNLYKGDQNCKVKLKQFNLGSETYSLTGGTDFTTWLAADIATFKSTTTANTVRVTVASQVTQAGVLTGDTISYTFADVSSCSSSFSGGAGTSTSPYLISTQTDLTNISGCSTGSTLYFKQSSNITLTGSWSPYDMYWNYDGNAKTISGLSITNSTSTLDMGLFKTIQTGVTVKNLTLSSVSITSNGPRTGALAGYNLGTVTSTSVSGTITATYAQGVSSSMYVGGLIGFSASGSSILNSSSSVNVVGNQDSSSGATLSLGGLVGHSITNITGSSASGNVSISTVNTATQVVRLGSFVGGQTNSVSSTSIKGSYSTGNITYPVGGTNTTVYAGFLGQFTAGTASISRCSSQGSITISSGAAASRIGGLLGSSVTSGGSISDSFTMSAITVSGITTGALVGGVVGTTPGFVTRVYAANMTLSSNVTARAFFGATGLTGCTNCYYYASAGIPADTSTNVTSRTAAQMVVLTNFTNFSTNNWIIPSANVPRTGLRNPVLLYECGVVTGISCTLTAGTNCVTGLWSDNSGSGTAGSPYVILTRGDLAKTQYCNTTATNFRQDSDINLGGSATPWTPIAFFSTYNGNSKNILDLYVSDVTGTAVALFGTMNAGSSVSNLNIVNVNLTGEQNIGALVGGVGGAITVTNVTSSGTISAQAGSAGSGINAGGLIGIMNSGGTVSGCSSSVNLNFVPSTASASQWHGVGGLIGHGGSSATTATLITDSYATGNVTSSAGTSGTAGTVYIGFGSLVGYTTANSSTSVTITRSYATGNQTHLLTGPSTGVIIGIGGILGLMLNTSPTILIVSKNFAVGTYTMTSVSTDNIQMGGIIGASGGSPGTGAFSDSYAMTTLSVTGTASTVGGMGGFIGNAISGVTVARSYSASPSISGAGMRTAAKFGFAGVASGTFTNDYYYANGSVPTQTVTGLTGYTTSTQMQTQSNYTNFDFTTTPVWKMPSANPLSPSGLLSPVLFWQCGTNGIVCP